MKSLKPGRLQVQAPGLLSLVRSAADDVVYRTISAHVLEKARLTRGSGATGAMTLIQRLGSALNLNIHFHMLALEGAEALGG